MDVILGYKDSLQYREDKIKSKINHESYSDLQRKTLQAVIEQTKSILMSKSKEL